MMSLRGATFVAGFLLLGFSCAQAMNHEEGEDGNTLTAGRGNPSPYKTPSLSPAFGEGSFVFGRESFRTPNSSRCDTLNSGDVSQTLSLFLTSQLEGTDPFSDEEEEEEREGLPQASQGSFADFYGSIPPGQMDFEGDSSEDEGDEKEEEGDDGIDSSFEGGRYLTQETDSQETEESGDEEKKYDSFQDERFQQQEPKDDGLQGLTQWPVRSSSDGRQQSREEGETSPSSYHWMTQDSTEE